MTSLHTIVLQTILVACFRGSLWLLCRKFLLRSLQQDIQGISSENTTSPAPHIVVPQISVEPPTPVTRSHPDSIEMSDLPAPASMSVGLGGLAGWPRTSPSSLARASFALCFEESCTLFAMLMAQAAGVMSSDARLLNWRISLCLLLVMNMIAVPLLFTHCLTSQLGSSSLSTRAGTHRTTPAKLFLASLPVIIYLFLLSYVPLPAGVSGFDPVESVLARLTVLGTAFLGLLSGFGAVNNAWTFLPSKLRHSEKEPTDDDVAAAERSLAHIREDLDRRRSELGKDTTQPATSTWFSRVLPSLRTDTASAQELRGLEALEADMAQNAAAIQQRRALAVAASTPLGRIQTLSGRVLAVYCVIRLVSALLNVVHPRPRQTQSPDLLSGLLAQVLAHAPVRVLREADAGALARQLGLALVGWILLGSVRSLLRGGSRVLRLARRAPRAALLLLALAQLMVTYVLSTLVQLRSSFVLPVVEGTDAMASLLATLPPCDVSGALFDRTFIAGAFGGIALRWMDERVNG